MAKKAPLGRPTDYNETIAAELCARIADGDSLRTICAADDMPAKATVFKWLAAHAAFVDQYARAREAQADAMAEEILQIADDGSLDTFIDDNGHKRTDQEVIGRSRLRVEARKWLMSKTAPKKYGDKMALTDGDGKPLAAAAPVFNVTVQGK